MNVASLQATLAMGSNGDEVMKSHCRSLCSIVTPPRRCHKRHNQAPNALERLRRMKQRHRTKLGRFVRISSYCNNAYARFVSKRPPITLMAQKTIRVMMKKDEQASYPYGRSDAAHRSACPFDVHAAYCILRCPVCFSLAPVVFIVLQHHSADGK